MFRNIRRLFSGTFSWGALLLEFVSIILAIYLGNLATDWHEKSNKQKETREALAYICEEIQSNKNRLSYTRNYYRRVVFLIDSLAQLDQFEKLFELEEFYNINPPLVETFAFEIAKADGNLSQIKFEQSASINLLYNHIHSLERFVEMAQQSIVKHELNTKDDWETIFYLLKEPVELFFRDLKNFEKWNLCVDGN